MFIIFFFQGLGFLYSVGLSFNGSQARALIHYTIAAIDGNDWAQMALGYRYMTGMGTYPDCEKGLDFYQKVSDKGRLLILFVGIPS